MLVIEKLRVKLDTKKGPAGVLHGLNGRIVVPGGGAKTFWQLLDFIKVGMPDGDLSWQVLKDPVTVSLHWKVAPLAFGAGITFARLKARHQIHRSAKRQRHLLMPAAHTQNWLTGFLYDFKNTGE